MNFDNVLSFHAAAAYGVEDVDMKAPRGLDKALFQKLIAGDWINRHQNLIVIGPNWHRKSWLACALGQKACRDDRPSSIGACRGCSMPWRWHAATAAMPGCSRQSHVSNS